MTVDGSRRTFLRMAAPAVALPIVASAPVETEKVRLVTQAEIMDAFRFYDGMELHAEDLNLRYQLLVEMLFETNPEKLREKLQVLKDKRKLRSVIVDAEHGHVAPYHPDMYDAAGKPTFDPHAYSPGGSHWHEVPAYQKQPLPSLDLRRTPVRQLKRWAKRLMRKRIIGI